jgi:hypothetical protein
MNQAETYSSVREYLDDLRRATRDIPPRRRREILADIESHFDASLTPASSEADIRDVIERLGTPEEIAAAERDRFGDPPNISSNRWERLTIGLLLVGFLATPVAWLVGVAMLWRSNTWTLKDKVLGTLVVPGGLGLALVPVLFFHSLSGTEQSCVNGTVDAFGTRSPQVRHCSGGGLSTTNWVALGVIELILIVAPIWTAWYLSRRRQ